MGKTTDVDVHLGLVLLQLVHVVLFQGLEFLQLTAHRVSQLCHLIKGMEVRGESFGQDSLTSPLVCHGHRTDCWVLSRKRCTSLRR